MNRLLPLAGAACAALLAAAPAPAQQRAQVMVLGTYHMDNPGLDYANLQADDVLTERRQAEIAQVARALAAWAPTRIAVEAAPEHDSLVNARYAAYRAGTRALTRSETEQIGFRLAAMLGHDRVHPIDWKKDMDIDAVFRFAMENGQGALVQELGGRIQAMIADMQARMATTPVGRILWEANSARADSMHGGYLALATIGAGDRYPGAEQVAAWYERNLHMYANIARVAAPGERVLVIVGSGHGTLLRQFVDEAPHLDRVDANDYLAAFRPPAPP